MLPRGAMGRPRTIQTPEIFDRLVDEYVTESHLMNEPMSITDLTLYLGFNDVGSLSDYGNRKGFEDFAPSVKRARLIVENDYVRAVRMGAGAGTIFLLKASYKYVDKQVVDLNATGDIKVVLDEKDLKA